MIKNDKENSEYLENQSKQDDLCDSYLQGATYVYQKYIKSQPKIKKSRKRR